MNSTYMINVGVLRGRTAPSESIFFGASRVIPARCLGAIDVGRAVLFVQGHNAFRRTDAHAVIRAHSGLGVGNRGLLGLPIGALWLATVN